MTKVISTVLTFTLLLFAALHTAALALEFDHTHSDYRRVLKDYVKDGLVDYSGLKTNPGDLYSYLHNMASVSQVEFKRWTKEQQLAYLVNLYNAQTLRLIIDDFPVESIKDINEPWDRPIVMLFEAKVSLNHLEHEIIRKNYQEPRVHFALVCAAMGCPKLPGEPFVPLNLDGQLNRRGLVFMSDTEKNTVDFKNKTVYLSPIFNWFEKDFVRESGSLLKFVAPFFPGDSSQTLSDGGFEIVFTEYDWSLNARGLRN